MLQFSEGHDARINGRAQAASRQSCRKINAFSTHKYAEKAKCYIPGQPINVKSTKKRKHFYFIIGSYTVLPPQNSTVASSALNLSKSSSVWMIR